MGPVFELNYDSFYDVLQLPLYSIVTSYILVPKKTSYFPAGKETFQYLLYQNSNIKC